MPLSLRKNTPHRHNRHKRKFIDRDGEDLVDELQVRNLGRFLHCHDNPLSLHTNGRVNDLVQDNVEGEPRALRDKFFEPVRSSKEL